MKSLSLSILSFIILTQFANVSFAKNDSLNELTQSLLTLTHQVKANQTKPALLHQINVMSVHRKSLILKALQENKTEQVLPFLLSETVRSSLTKEVQENLEKKVSLEGEVELRIVDFNDKKTAEIQYLVKYHHQVFYLYFTQKLLKPLSTGDLIKIKQAYQLPRAKNSYNLIVDPNDIFIVKKSKAIPSSLGPQSTVAIAVNFSNEPNNQPRTIEQLNALFADVSNMYYESSYHQTTLVTKVIGWYTLDIKNTDDCDTLLNNMGPMAADAAAKAGEDLSKYKHRVYLFPPNYNCQWLGLGTIGTPATSYSSAWINNAFTRMVVGHELGHNLGITHAKYLNCPNVVENENCTSIEYGDNSDIMGINNPAHFNAYNKDMLGWLNYGISPPITTITRSGTFFIEPYETTSNQPKALKILKQTLADGSSDYYYVEFRQGIGYDAILANCGNNCDFTKGVLIHRGNSVNVNSSYVIDMTPDVSDIYNNFIALLPGKSFSNPNAANGGMKITLNSISAAGASVKIDIGNAPPLCESKMHTLTISPTFPQWVNAGSAADYTLTLTNNDSASCPASKFSLASSVYHQAITANLNTQWVSLDAGQSKTINLRLIASHEALTGLYMAGISATNRSNSIVASVIANLGVNP